MNKELTPLEALRNLTQIAYGSRDDIDDKINNYFELIEKSLKALEIIKEKAKDQLHYLVISRNYDEYLRYCDDNNIPLQVRYSLEEYDLLKEVLL